MQMDRVTEAIAHFIGLFGITIEEARLREAYREFEARKTAETPIPDLPQEHVPFEAPYQLLGYEPGLAYQAPPQPIIPIYPAQNLAFNRLEVPLGGRYDPLSGESSLTNVIYGGSHRILLPEIEPVGSVASYLFQEITLSDDDYFGVGGHGLVFSPDAVGDSQLAALAEDAAELMPLDELEMPGTAEEVVAFVKSAADILNALPEDQPDNVTVVKSEQIVGSFVNGARIEGDIPRFEDHHSFEDESEEESQGNVQLTEHGVEIDVSVTVDTGSNTLVNNAILKNYWTGAPVTAVMGEHVEINAIIQVNAWCDGDYVSSAVGDWIRQSDPTQSFNIATFERFGDFGEQNSTLDPEPDFPEHWVVTRIEGDLMIMSWLQQLTLMTDNDIGILSSSGVTSRIYSGENNAYNDISLEQIGFGYDLIIIGGNVYDASIIQQLNILNDNDLVGAVNGFETTGEGSLSTAGNLLWNQAYIYNVGDADRFEAMPEAYRQTAEKLAAGEDYINSGVLSDSAFAGIGALRVLYISGDLLNLQYIKQTNILGDSDQLALAMDATKGYPGADWSVTTGSNTLANNAAIMDLDALGKTYVGEGHYSTEVLIQADIISTEPDIWGQNPDALVNEAVAFLDDDMAGADSPDYVPAHQGEVDYLHSDGVNTMLG